MNAACQGAQENDGLTIGIIPNNDLNNVSDLADISISTEIDLARNNINVISSDVVVAMAHASLGTISEVVLGSIATGTWSFWTRTRSVYLSFGILSLSECFGLKPHFIQWD